MADLDDKNIALFRNLLKVARPDIFLYMELIDETQVNTKVLQSVIRHISNIANGTRFGKVTIEIDNGQVTFVRGEESDKLFERALATPIYKHSEEQNSANLT